MFSSEWTSLLSWSKSGSDVFVVVWSMPSGKQIILKAQHTSEVTILSESGLGLVIFLPLTIFIWHLLIFFSSSLLFLSFFISVICLAVFSILPSFLPFDPLHNKQCRAKQGVGYTLKAPNSSLNYRQPTYDNVFYLNHRPQSHIPNMCAHISTKQLSHMHKYMCAMLRDEIWSICPTTTSPSSS